MRHIAAVHDSWRTGSDGEGCNSGAMKRRTLTRKIERCPTSGRSQRAQSGGQGSEKQLLTWQPPQGATKLPPPRNFGCPTSRSSFTYSPPVHRPDTDGSHLSKIERPSSFEQPLLMGGAPRTSNNKAARKEGRENELRGISAQTAEWHTGHVRFRDCPHSLAFIQKVTRKVSWLFMGIYELLPSHNNCTT